MSDEPKTRKEQAKQESIESEIVENHKKLLPFLDKILDYFPYTPQIKTMRPQQKEALLWIAEQFRHGKRKVVLLGPVGVGKSAILIAVARMFAAAGLSFDYTSPMNNLVYQVRDSFGSIVATITGRDNYPCKFGDMIGEPCTCAEGMCRAKTCRTHYLQFKQGKLGHKSQVYAPKPCDECRTDCVCAGCTYKIAFKNYMEASIANTNFSLFLARLRESTCTAVDECDLVKSFIRMSMGYTVREKWRVGLDWERYLTMIKEIRDERNLEFIEAEKVAGLNPTDKRAIRKVKRLTEELLTLNNILTDQAKTNPEPWVDIHSEVQDRYQNTQHSTRVEPITVERFINDMFNETSYVIFASATPVIPEGWPYLELSSPFPTDVRPIIYENCGKMNLRDRPQSIPKLAAYIIALLKKRSCKTLVHCFSYQIAKDLARAMRDQGFTHTILQTKADDIQHALENIEAIQRGEEVTRNRAIETFLQSPWMDAVCLSVGMGSGLNLYHHKGCREYVGTNIIAKLPYPNPYDPVVMAEEKYLSNAKEEQNKEMARDITQKSGRCNRDEVKFAVTIVTDGNWPRWFNDNEQYFPKYFMEAVTKPSKVDWSR